MPQQFEIDDDVVELVQRLAKPKAFEPFRAALRRLLQSGLDPAHRGAKNLELDELDADAMAAKRASARKAPTPSPSEWVASVPDLRTKRGLNTWKAICDLLKIDTGGDSARRRLKNWVKTNRPSWPAVPDID